MIKLREAFVVRERDMDDSGMRDLADMLAKLEDPALLKKLSADAQVRKALDVLRQGMKKVGALPGEDLPSGANYDDYEMDDPKTATAPVVLRKPGSQMK